MPVLKPGAPLFTEKGAGSALDSASETLAHIRKRPGQTSGGTQLSRGLHNSSVSDSENFTESDF